MVEDTGDDRFLPITRQDMKRRHWEEADFVYISGDAYVDHSSYGTAIISRLLERYGYRIAVIPQPDWKDEASIQVFGRPKLGFLVSAGNMDSMVNHYTVSKKRRSEDAYSPGGRIGLRPDRACIVYSNLIRRVYKDIPIILGGIEASLRRLAHYDYWEDRLRRSILLDSGADLVSYGMGERSVLAIAEALQAGIPIKELTYIAGTVYKCHDISHVQDPVILPSYDEMTDCSRRYADSFAIQYIHTDPFTARPLVESYGGHGYVVQNPPSKPLSMQEMDDVYALPFTGEAHPVYAAEGGVPSLSEVRFSLTSCRGCYGGCSFCALTFHEGRIVQCRSHASIIEEAKRMTQSADFKGYIHDVGGPTADFRGPSCDKQLKKGVCPNRQCLFPEPCPNLKVDHKDYLSLLRKLRSLPGVKKVFVRSGIRFDYCMADPDPRFLNELAAYHVSGQLRVAPEHVSDRVLTLMGKPPHRVYLAFTKAFEKATKRAGKEQYAVPYFMSSHPGCGIREAIELAEYIRDLGYMPEQVQDFYPTPSTLSTCMYFTGIHPLTGEKVYTAKAPGEKAIQRALMQYRRPEMRELVLEGLRRAHRMDLVGYGPKCLLRPEKTEKKTSRSGAGKDRGSQTKSRRNKDQHTAIHKTGKSRNKRG
ncbi:MAG: YgiQ family radical SAM protein [Blautia sp.]|nr:YgiQ family radical SAM protein [Blautia sp.]